MQITKKHWVAGGIGMAVAISIGAYYAFQQRSSPLPDPLPIVSGDTIVSWDWNGPYKDGGPLEKKATDEIARLSAMTGKGEYPDYQLLVGIAGQYELLGEGTKTYDYLEQAVRMSTTTGLAWYNLGVLFERYGALHTARVAYAKAAAVEPLPLYVQKLEEFLKEHPDMAAPSTP